MSDENENENVDENGISDAEKLSTEYYKEYIGCYAKRFYTPFEEGNMFKIVGFELDEYKPNYLHYYTDEDGNEKHELRERDEYCYFAMFLLEEGEDNLWKSDVEDSVIITNNKRYKEDERVVFTGHPQYKGYNPFTGTIKK